MPTATLQHIRLLIAVLALIFSTIMVAPGLLTPVFQGTHLPTSPPQRPTAPEPVEIVVEVAVEQGALPPDTSTPGEPAPSMPDETPYIPHEQLGLGSPEWRGFVPAPKGAVAWTDAQVFRIHNGDHRLIHRGGAPDKAVVDSKGTVFLVYGRQLNVVTLDGKRRAHALPFARTTEHLLANRDVLVWSGQREDGSHAVGVSFNQGRTWRHERAEVGRLGYQLALSPGGALQLVTGTEAGCGGGYQWRVYSHVRTLVWSEDDWPLDAVDWYAGDGRWSYAQDTCHDDESGYHVCAVSGAGDVTPLFGVPDDALLHVVTRGRHTAAIVGDRVYKLHGRRNVQARGRLPKGVDALALDDKGRLMGLHEGRILRFTWPR